MDTEGIIKLCAGMKLSAEEGVAVHIEGAMKEDGARKLSLCLMRASSPGKGRPPGSSSKSHGHGHGIPGSKPMIDGSSSTKRDHSISGKVGMVAANGNPHQNLVEEIMETGVHESLNHENGRHQEFREEADHMEIVALDGTGQIIRPIAAKVQPEEVDPVFYFKSQGPRKVSWKRLARMAQDEGQSTDVVDRKKREKCEVLILSSLSAKKTEVAQ
ncbi:hypothetical protein ACOSQ3_031876 [Xanthoceras sorbifolium]